MTNIKVEYSRHFHISITYALVSMCVPANTPLSGGIKIGLRVVFMYIKNKWTVMNIHKDEHFEFFTIDIKLLNSLKINVGVANRPPDSYAQWIEGLKIGWRI